MKKSILLISALAALPCCPVFAADVSAANTFGLLKVTSYAKRTIVAVPWVDCGTGTEQDVSVSNVVKTANLTAGDKLSVVQATGTYQTWVLEKDSDNTLYWKSATLVDATGKSVSGTADVETITRGSALILERQSPGTKESPVPFYLFGQVASSGTVSFTIPFRGTEKAPAYTFVAPPTTVAQPINGTGATWANVGENDRLITVAGDGSTGVWLYWNAEEGKWYSPKTGKAYGNSIAVGKGVWYASYDNAAASAPSVTWSANVPHTGND